MDYYQVLGVGRKARLADIKKAYKRLARRCHPDLHPGDRSAGEQFRRITEAYEVLSDPARRRRYDQGGAGEGPSRPGPAAGFGGGVEFPGSAFGAGFSEIFEEIFNPRPAHRRREPGPGEDRIYPIRIGFLESLRGLSTTLEHEAEAACPDCTGTGSGPAPRPRTCPECRGSGRIDRLGGSLRFSAECRRCAGAGSLSEEPCRHCAGSGRITRRERIQVSLPPGVDTGSRVRLAGKGGPGVLGGPPGDLYIQIQVDSHPVFSRAGDQILCTLPISITEAALGSRVEVPTIDGPSVIRIPPGTQSGQRFRLRGKGAPSLRGASRGDQIVEVKVVTPDIRDERTRDLLRQLAEIDAVDLRAHLRVHS